MCLLFFRYIIYRSHRLMKTSSIAVIAINIQSDSILRQTNKVHFLTEKNIISNYTGTTSKHAEELQLRSASCTKIHKTTLNYIKPYLTSSNYTKLHQLTPNYTKLQQTTLNNTELYKLRKTAIGLPSELQCTRLKLI